MDPVSCVRRYLLNPPKKILSRGNTERRNSLLFCFEKKNNQGELRWGVAWCGVACRRVEWSEVASTVSWCACCLLFCCLLFSVFVCLFVCCGVWESSLRRFFCKILCHEIFVPVSECLWIIGFWFDGPFFPLISLRNRGVFLFFMSDSRF